MDTPPARPPGAGEERQGQRVLDVVQRFLRRFPQPLRLPVVRPTVRMGERRGYILVSGERGWEGIEGDKIVIFTLAMWRASNVLLQHLSFHRFNFPLRLTSRCSLTLAPKWQAMDSPGAVRKLGNARGSRHRRRPPLRSAKGASARVGGACRSYIQRI